MAKTKKEKTICPYCGKELVDSNFYKSNSILFSNTGKIQYCRQCIEQFYQHYYDKYMNEGSLNSEQNAIKRICMAFDIYYSDKVFNSAMDKIKRDNINISPLGQYMRQIQLSQYKGKSYDNTILEEEERKEREHLIVNATTSITSDDVEIDEKTINFFGAGFKDEDYIFLKREYGDWTTRHECQTKSQEEIFKDICFNRLQNLKALQRGEDTKDITASFQKLLDSGKLQPKQNSTDTLSDAQTFGTLIDKWETTRPIPEIEEELRDVDKIGYLIHVFFTGHMAKVLDLSPSLSKIYDKYIKKYTVEKQKQSGESDDEVLFDKIFGKKNIDDEPDV